MLVWENAKLPSSLPDLTIIVLNFKAPESITVSNLSDLPYTFALTGHNPPWDLSDLWYNLRSFYSRPHADAPNLLSACLLVSHET